MFSELKKWFMDKMRIATRDRKCKKETNFGTEEYNNWSENSLEGSTSDFIKQKIESVE